MGNGTFSLPRNSGSPLEWSAEGKRTIYSSCVGKTDRKHRKSAGSKSLAARSIFGSAGKRIMPQATKHIMQYYPFLFQRRTFSTRATRAAYTGRQAAPTAGTQSMSQAARTGRVEDDKPFPFRRLDLSTSSACTAYAVQRYVPARGGRPTGQSAWTGKQQQG